MARPTEQLEESPSSQKLLPPSSPRSPRMGGRVGEYTKDSKDTKDFKPSRKAPFAFFSQRVGVTDGLGLQDCMATLNPGEEDQLEVWGYKSSPLRLALALALTLATGLLPLGLLLYWHRHWWVAATKQRCTLEEADTVVVVDHYKGLHTTRFVKSVYRRQSATASLAVPAPGGGYRLTSDLRWFSVKKQRYYWDTQEAAFLQVAGLDRGVTVGGLLRHQGGLAAEEGRRRAALYGPNEIAVPLEGLGVLLVKELLSPFYVFQIFSICFWYADDYWMYATAILATSVVSLTSALYQTRTNQANLRDTIVTSEVVTRLRAGGAAEEVLSSELVPGDVLAVPDHGCQLLCDAVLLSGSVIMNEAMLTGESVPVTKVALARGAEEQVYSARAHERSTLKCGTTVIQTRKAGSERVTAVVVRTGYLTSKGSLVRSILYPPPVDFQFEKDSYKFIVILAMIATIGMVYTLVKMVLDGEDVVDIILEVFDLITIVVPPALPAAMTIGIVMASQRLLPHGIYCISPRTINVAGTADCVCFDKTGTITEDGLDMWGVVPTRAGLAPLQGYSSTVGAAAGGGAGLGWGAVVQGAESLGGRSQLLLGMATCHELNMVEGEVLGDPLDDRMFAWTGWDLEVEGEEVTQADRLQMPYMRGPAAADRSVLQAAPLKLFPFSSELQRMTVVTRIVEEQVEEFSTPSTYVFCKGSPERVGAMCLPGSLPPDYRAVLASHTSRGFRIIALAGRLLAPATAKHSRLRKLTREQAEEGLSFLGLVVLENRLKPVSKVVLGELRGARIRTVMVTGDNILTAVSVARDAALLPPGDAVVQVLVEEDVEGELVVEYVALEQEEQAGGGGRVVVDPTYHFAVEGPAFEAICERGRDTVLPFLATRGAVFARMSPDMKQRLVEILQDLDYQVIMCGDGANDCGALKAANAGISLSEAEASVAAPFTSKTPDISCVPALIRESRAALVTSFGIFKYMAGYSITQFVSVMILYNIYSNLSDFQFVYIDLFLITTIAALFGFNRAHRGPLAPTPPISSLFSPLPIFSLLSQLAIAISFQVGALYLTTSQPWFEPFDYQNACYKNTSLEAVFQASGIEAYWGAEVCTEEEDPVASLENFAIFSVSQFQYIILAVAFAKGVPYREPMWRNKPLLMDIVLLLGFSLFLTIQPEAWRSCGNYFMLLPPPPPLSYRVELLALAAANLLASLAAELYLSDVLVRRAVTSRDKAHEVVERQLRLAPDWPPLSRAPAAPRSPEEQEASAPGGEVIVTETGGGVGPDQAFNSLFHTPDSSSHSAAAVSLNPPPVTPVRQLGAGAELLLQDASPGRGYTTARPSPASSTPSSGDTGRFVSCGGLDLSPGTR